MNNLYDIVQANPKFNRLEIGELLFAEYTCPLDTEMFGIWTQQDYFVHVLTGRKTWHTPDGSWKVEGGETLFFKKGAAVVEQHFEVNFCLMIFFVPDSIIREVVREHQTDLGRREDPANPGQAAIPVQSETGLNAFFESMRHYFTGSEKPQEALLRLKLKELIVSILLSTRNPDLSSYFVDVAEGSGPPLHQIMEKNYRYRLSLEEFARLCHRSLSTFKRDFQKHFQETPGRWILQKRLDYAAALLRSSEDMNVTDVLFESGFEDVSHFSKAFKNRFGKSPSSYRLARS